MMPRIGQYRTETELREEIKRLEEIAAKGELTLPLARDLNHLCDELDQIVNTRYQSTARGRISTDDSASQPRRDSMKGEA